MPKPVERFASLLERMKRLPMFTPRLGGLQVEITLPQLALLGWVADHPGSHVHSLAEALGLTAPTVSVGVRRLVRAGLLERRPDPQDRRAVKLHLTHQAEQMHALFLQRRNTTLELFLAGLTPAEQRTLLDLLEKAVTTAESQPAHSQGASKE